MPNNVSAPYLSLYLSLSVSLSLVLWLLLFLFSLLFVLVYSATIVVSFGIVICCCPCLLSRCLFVSSVSRDSPYPYPSLLPLLPAGPFNPGSQQVLAEDNGPKPKPAGGVGPFGGVLLSRFLSLLLPPPLSVSLALSVSGTCTCHILISGKWQAGRTEAIVPRNCKCF